MTSRPQGVPPWRSSSPKSIPARWRRQQSDGQQHRNGGDQIGKLSVRVGPHLGQDCPSGDNGHYPDWDVDKKHPSPAGLDEQAADGRARRGRDRGGASPDPDHQTVLTLRERREQQAERGRHDHGGADGLNGPRTDENAEVGCNRAEGGRQREDTNSSEEESSASEMVSKSPRLAPDRPRRRSRRR
jgi:hypothetical protein